MPPIQIRVYSRPECHLCDDAKAILDQFATQYPLEIEVVNIDEDPQAFELYRYEIPVIFVNGQKLFKYRIDEQRLTRALESRK